MEDQACAQPRALQVRTEGQEVMVRPFVISLEKSDTHFLQRTQVHSTAGYDTDSVVRAKLRRVHVVQAYKSMREGRDVLAGKPEGRPDGQRSYRGVWAKMPAAVKRESRITVCEIGGADVQAHRNVFDSRHAIIVRAGM